MLPSSLDSRVQECFNAQSHLGWTGFLEGFLTTDWACMQQDYFTRKGSQRTGHCWAVNLSKQLWQLVFSQWTHWNHIHHQSGANDILRGIEHVHDAIRYEFSIGQGELDPIYSSYFKSCLKTLLQKSSVTKRRWLLLIRRARGSKHHHYTDV